MAFVVLIQALGRIRAAPVSPNEAVLSMICIRKREA
jgi:hypothetical protein